MYIKSTNSTNTLLKELMAKGEWLSNEQYLRAGYQTAGRGQTGNGWESEKDKNLLCSIPINIRRWHSAMSSFYLNVLVSVAVQRVLGEAFCIKWPNDIYWGDRKIAGILIENAIIGNEVTYSIAGIGLNVNQTEWHSDAPNPVSLKQITGKEQDIEALMNRLMEEIDHTQQEPQEQVWAYYKAHLYRREGFWPFVEREVNITPTMNAQTDTNAFLARIADVLPTGEIVLEDEHKQQRIYHFKQIRYVV